MPEPIIVDSHCHLDFPDFDGEHDALIARAADAGVTRMVTICTRLKNEPQVRALAEKYDPVFYAAGTHPMSAAEEPLATTDELITLAQHPKFVGIGETGLDYHYTADSADIQQQSLRVHIDAARETKLPLIIHGFYLSMSGITAFPKSQELRDIFAAAPLDRILVETDSPYLAPPPHRGKRNEPSFTAHTARKAAETFGLDYADFAARTTANFDRLFWKAA